MSFNGSGTFLINTAGQPVVSGTVISSTAFNALTADLATGLSTAITKDGQTTVTANIPMSTYKFTGLGVGSAATDSANLSQVQSTVTKLLTSVSGTDTITAVGAPVVAAYAAGQMFYFVATGDNTGAVTLNIDSLGAKAVTRDGSVALAAGDIKNGEVVVVVYDGTRFQVVSQLNSAGNATFANVSIASSLYVGGVSTFVGNAGFSANVSIASALSVGGVAAITGATTIGGNLTLSGGTANGVLYLNGSKVATSGSALTFDGTKLVASGGNEAIRIASGAPYYSFYNAAQSTQLGYIQHTGTDLALVNVQNGTMPFYVNNAEGMRLTSTGLGIGTSSPGYKLDVRGVTASGNGTITTGFTYDTRGLVGTFSNHALGFITNGASPTMLLDTSGNLGLGVTPSAWQSGVKAFQNGAGALYTINTVQQRLSLNAYRDSAGTMRYINSSINAAEFRMGEGDGSFQFHTAPSGTAGNAISFTQAMTLDANGSLLVGGTTLAASFGGYKTIEINGSTGGLLSLNSNGVNKFQMYTNGSQTNLATVTSEPMTFLTNSTERARITSGGVVAVNTTGAVYNSEKLAVLAANNSLAAAFKTNAGATEYTVAVSNTATSGDNLFIVFATESTDTARGSITYNRAGGLVAYNTTSDYRAKNIIGPVQDSGATIDALKVYEGQMKGATQSRPMLVAHEAQEHAPYAVTGEKDAVNEDGTPKYQQMDVSALVPLLLAEIQSLRARVAQLETK